jgi:hypothetical protein
MLTALHAERESAAEEQRRKAEQEEDDAMVAQYFAKIPTASTNGVKDKGKGKEKAVSGPEGDEVASDADSDSDGEIGLPASLTVKRRPAPTSGSGKAEPSVAALLAERAKANGVETPTTTPSAVPAQAKRKRGDMQKLLGIKKKAK